MQTTTIKLVTIIAEGVLEERLLHDLKDLGARGYTISDVRGHGTRGISDGQWPVSKHKIEVLALPEVATAILEHLDRRYFNDYAIIAYLADVEVVREEKYR